MFSHHQEVLMSAESSNEQPVVRRVTSMELIDEPAAPMLMTMSDLIPADPPTPPPAPPDTTGTP